MQRTVMSLQAKPYAVTCTAVPSKRAQIATPAAVPRKLQRAAASLAAAFMVAQPALALDLPELPNPFAKSETEQTREAVSEQTANLPSLEESNNPTDFNAKKVPGLKARSTKSSGELANVTPKEDSQGLNDVEERKPGKKGGELLSGGGAEFNPSGNR